MELDYHCERCGRMEMYNRQPNTTFICSRCVQIMVGKCKSISDLMEKQKVQPRRSQRLRITKKKQTLATCEVSR
jgi:hypothetical protein